MITDTAIDATTAACPCVCCVELVNAISHGRTTAFLKCWCHTYNADEQCACSRCVDALAARAAKEQG